MKRDTLIVTAGRNPERFEGAVNPPIYRASTVLSPSLDDWNDKKRRQKSGAPGFYYGRSGTPTGAALLEAVASLEGAHAAAVFPSGLAACAVAILSVANAGDHILITDTAYGPVRRLADGLLRRMGIITEYYDPTIGAGIEAMFRPNTRLVYLESPGSHTMEMQDIPAIAAVAARRDARVVLDNTWSALTFCKPFALGVDITVHAATKYIVGHSDVVMGIACANEATWTALNSAALDMGQTTSPDDCYLALRGLRTMGVRLRQHDMTGRRLAHWLTQQPEVARTLHPALPDDPGHAIWTRDFTGACGLFSFELNADFTPFLPMLMNNLQLFGIGASWGGFESLALPASVTRTAVPGSHHGLIRLHAGLEDAEDLVADLDHGFAAMRLASKIRSA